MMRRNIKFIALFFGFLCSTSLLAEGELLNITPDNKTITFNSVEGLVTLQRFSNDIMLVKGTIRPMVPMEGVTPVGELEVINALQSANYIVVDTRTSVTQYGGTIPGSISVPFDEITEQLDALGCIGSIAKWNCMEAYNVVLYCNGPNCGQSPRAMAAMVEVGFPSDKIFYYRGGMLAWTSLGLTTRESMHRK
jgi:rhodanese-related sulfurtransferase